jgi:hypothetical protein
VHGKLKNLRVQNGGWRFFAYAGRCTRGRCRPFGYLTFFRVHQYTGFSEILKRRGLRSSWSPSVVLRLLSSPILDDLAPREQSLI